MLTFIHKNGQYKVIGRWLFDLGPFHVVKDGWNIYF